MKKILLMVFGVWWWGSLGAAIEFEYVTWEKGVSSVSKGVEFSFPFRNTGDKPVEISRIHSSCGCTVARLDKKTYMPGESGEIVGIFNLAGRSGRQISSLRVMTDDAAQRSVELRVVVTILRLLNVQPGLLVWRAGAPLEAQRVVLTPDKESGVRVVEVNCDAPGFEARLMDGENGSYVLEVTPRELRERGRWRIRIKSYRGESETPDWHVVHLRVL